MLRGVDQPTLEEEGRTKTPLLTDVKSALKNRSARMTIAAQAFLSGATDQSIVVTYTALFLKNGLRLGSVETSLLYSTTMIAGVLGTLIVGRYADRIGSLKTAIINTLIASSAILALGFQRSPGYSLTLNLIVVGLSGFPIFNLMQAHISSVSQPAERDILIGVFFTIGFGISSVWATLIGYTIDVYGSFSPAWTLMAGLGVIGALFQLRAYRSRR